MLYRVRISKSYGGEAPMYLVSQYTFTTKSDAITKSLSLVPENTEINWTSSKYSNDDIKFDFRVKSCTYQVWIDEMPVDPPDISLSTDQTITQLPIWSSSKGYHFDY